MTFSLAANNRSCFALSEIIAFVLVIVSVPYSWKLQNQLCQFSISIMLFLLGNSIPPSMGTHWNTKYILFISASSYQDKLIEETSQKQNI